MSIDTISTAIFAVSAVIAVGVLVYFVVSRKKVWQQMAAKATNVDRLETHVQNTAQPAYFIPALPIDFTPFTKPKLAREEKQHYQTGPFWIFLDRDVHVIIFVCAMIPFLLLILISLGVSVGLILAQLFIAIFAFGAFFLIAGKSIFAQYDLDTRYNMFAELNGFVYTSKHQGPAALEEISTFVHQASLGVLKLSPELRLAPYSFTVGEGDDKVNYTGCYLRFTLPQATPHIIVDARNSLSRFPISTDYQQLELEGNFNDYFTVHIPQNQHIDALTILTPDVMSVLIEYAIDLDIELVDNYLYIFKPNSLPIPSSDTEKSFRQFLLVSDLIIKEINEQVGTKSRLR